MRQWLLFRDSDAWEHFHGSSCGPRGSSLQSVGSFLFVQIPFLPQSSGDFHAPVATRNACISLCKANLQQKTLDWQKKPPRRERRSHCSWPLNTLTSETASWGSRLLLNLMILETAGSLSIPSDKGGFERNQIDCQHHFNHLSERLDLNLWTGQWASINVHPQKHTLPKNCFAYY